MLKMPFIFSNHMVLQRQKAVVVWGWSDADAVVNVSLLKANQVLSHASAIACAEGDWKLTLPALEAECNLTLMIKSGEEEIRYTDVLIGEVWIAGGQSNMQYWMEYDAEKEIELARAANPNIRFFDMPQIPYEGAMEDYSYTDSGFWRTCDRENLPWFSAVGYYCAVQLEKSLGVPVGIVGCNWGGTRACCWMDESYLRGTAGEIWLTEYEESLKGLNLDEYHRSYRGAPENVPSRLLPDPGEILLWPGLSREQQAQMLAMKASVPQPPYAEFIGPDHPWRPCGLYHTMLKKIVPYTARGVLWYQGESDASHPEIYDIVLKNLIRNWRNLWGEELPFLMVQLAPFENWLTESGESFPVLRQRQQQVADTVPGVWLCSNGDGGMRWDIHPKHKRSPGERLALLARGHIYGQDILCDAPRMQDVISCGSEAAVRFVNAEGLNVQGDSVNGLLVNGVPCQASTCFDMLVIPLPEGDHWRIQYAWQPYYEANLYNAAHLPALPFTVELDRNAKAKHGCHCTA